MCRILEKCVLILVIAMICGLSCGFTSTAGMDSMTVYVDGRAEYTAYTINGTIYVPVRSFCGSLGMGSVAIWDAASGTLTVSFTEQTADGPKAHSLRACAGACYVQLDHRTVYLDEEALERSGNLLVPMQPLCSAFGVAMGDRTDGVLCLDMTRVQVCPSGRDCYDETDLLWLSRIIHAEAGNQCMEGKLAVGNVVLNRVRDRRFPNSVSEVIFAPGQFCPVTNGNIYCSPDEAATAAAKLCLEGVNPIGSCTYFVNPRTGATKWFRENLTYAETIQDHDFYY